MKTKGLYFLCTVLLAALVLSAFFAPSVIVKMNDNSLFETIVLESRDGIDYEMLDLQYEDELDARLNAFSKGLHEGRKYYIASSGKSENDLNNLQLESVFEQEIFYVLADMGIFFATEEIFDIAKISDWDYYVIYGDDVTAGAAFLCWYLEITTDEQKIRVLCDSKDYSVYYMECYHFGVSYHFEKGLKSFWKYLINEFKYLDNYYVYDQEGGDLFYEMLFENGSLRHVVGFVENMIEDEVYQHGIRIGIEEVAKLLPKERKGLLLRDE